jgi:hypothetical protein
MQRKSFFKVNFKKDWERNARPRLWRGNAQDNKTTPSPSLKRRGAPTQVKISENIYLDKF